MARASSKRRRNIQSTYEDCIQEHVRGKKVLDVGCVAHDASKKEDEPWVHELIEQDAEYVKGIDILEGEVEKLKEQGHNVCYGNIQDLDLEENYDVIVMGEVIEHLTNFQGMMMSIDRNLKSEGKLVITTPNILAVRCFAMELLGMDWVNDEHTCYFESSTLQQLVEKYGFTVTEWNYSKDLSLRLNDPLQSIGWLFERVLPTRVGDTTMGAVIKRKRDE